MLRFFWFGTCLFIIANVLTSVSRNNVGLASLRDKPSLFQSPSSFERAKNFFIWIAICSYFILAYVYKFYIYKC